MIIRSRPSMLDVLFAVRGSILPNIFGQLLVMAVVSIGAILLSHSHPGLQTGLNAMPFTLLGLSISIFMSFRNSTSYERWWEGRKLWGQFVIAARSFARQSAHLDKDEREPLLCGLCAVAAGLAARLQDEDEIGAIEAHIGPGSWSTAPNPTDAALSLVGQGCQRLVERKLIDTIQLNMLETQLTEISHVQGGCERIKATPLPFAYSLLLHRTAHLFCLSLPFALASTLDWWTLPLVVVVSYAFFGLDRLSDELADPFGNDSNDLPLGSIVRTIERDLGFAAGHRDLPPVEESRAFRLR